MFRHQGPTRSEQHNRVLAGYLAFVGGFVNSSGFVLVGTFTSPVTGNIGRFTTDMATHHYSSSAAAIFLVAAFFAGAFVASVVIESSVFGSVANAYGVALSGEAGLLALFTVISISDPSNDPRVLDMEAAILCMAMGMQNSLVTRLSGAVVRTTHLTGVVTDLGIEAARWFRHGRASLPKVVGAKVAGVSLSFGTTAPERPSGRKVALLGIIAVAFTMGALCGSFAVASSNRFVMAFPCVAVAACALAAFIDGRRRGADGSIPPGSRR